MHKSLTRGLRITLTTVLAAVALALPAAAAGATTPTPVAFETTMHVVSGTPGPGPGNNFYIVAAGTGTASGAVSDTFTIAANTVLTYGPPLHIDDALTGTNGTIAIRIDAQFVGFTATTAIVHGVWTITSGTGSYAGLHGSGTYDATVNTGTHIVSESLNGFAEYDSGS